MSIIGAAGGAAARSIASVANGGSTPPPSVDDGVQILTNSKLSGPSTAVATDWRDNFIGAGSATYSASAVAEHRKVRLAAGSGERAIIEQNFDIVSGLTYVISCYVTAVDDATDGSQVILNHNPFSAADPVGGAESRPTLGDASGGTRVSYAIVAQETTTIEVQIGINGEGDITLERPMVDQDDELRNYVASDPAPAPEVPDELFLPYFGQWIGNPRTGSTGNNTTRTDDSARRGYRLRAPADCTVTRMQFQVASNFDGEGALPQRKSRLDGVNDHGYPAAFPMTWAVYTATASGSSWTISGSALDSGSVTATNVDGAQGPSGDSRMLITVDCNFAMTAGQRAILALTNSSTPSSTHWSLNADAVVSASWRPSPLTDGPFFSDDFLCVRETGTGTNVFGLTNGMLSGVACFTSAGWEFGQNHMDSTPSGLSFNIGGSNRVRQYVRPQLSGNITKILAALWKTGAGTTNALTVRITGPSVDRTTNIPATEFVDAATAYNPAIYTISALALVAGNDYLIEVSSPTSVATAYQSIARRQNTQLNLATTTSLQNPAPTAGVARASQHGWGTPWDGTGEKSSNGGSSWGVLGYPGGGSDISIGLGFE